MDYPHLTPDEITTLAEVRYTEHGNREGRLFGLLVDVAWEYEKELRRQASESPAPFLGATPREALIRGLGENLDMVEESRSGELEL